MAQCPEASKTCLAQGARTSPLLELTGFLAYQVQRPKRRSTAVARLRPTAKRGDGAAVAGSGQAFPLQGHTQRGLAVSRTLVLKQLGGWSYKDGIDCSG